MRHWLHTDRGYVNLDHVATIVEVPDGYALKNTEGNTLGITSSDPTDADRIAVPAPAGWTLIVGAPEKEHVSDFHRRPVLAWLIDPSFDESAAKVVTPNGIRSIGNYYSRDDDELLVMLEAPDGSVGAVVGERWEQFSMDDAKAVVERLRIAHVERRERLRT